MKFISHLLRSSSSQNLPYSCASDFEINRRGDHRSPVLQTRNFNRGPRKAKAFWGKGVNCAKHKRHVAPNSLLRSVAKFGVSCHRFEPYTFLHKNKKDTIRYPFYFGGNNRARTCDPLLVRQMLSQLSYAPVSDIDYITSCGECQEFILEKSSFILSISLFKYK